MASPKSEAVALELPKGTLLIGTAEKDGVVTETKAFRVAEGVVTIDTVIDDGAVKKTTVAYHNGWKLVAETMNGKQTTGVLLRVRE